MSRNVPTATVVVGIGEAGLRMLSKLDGVIDEEDIDDRQFTLLAIDSKNEDLGNIAAVPDRNQFPLEGPPDNRWHYMVEESHTAYLRHGDEPASQGGVTRNRPVARALVDDSENFDALHGFFETRIENFIDNLGVTDVDIWLINSLGGGTGSGTFPLVGAMLHNVAQQLKRRDPNLGFDIAGIGSLPQLTRVHEGPYPDARPRHIINSYLALRELKAILDHDYSAEPLRIDVYAEEADNIRDPYIELDEAPFEKYFLLPVQESEIRNEATRERLNAIVADLILYFSHITGVENYPDTEEEYDDEVLYTINSSELGFPTELATEYVETVEAIRNISTRERKLKQLRDEYRSNQQYLEAVLEVNYGESPDQDSEIEERLVSQCENAAEATVQENQIRYLDEEQLNHDASAAVEEMKELVSSRVERFNVAVELGSGDDEHVRTVGDDVPLLANEEGESIDPVGRTIEYFYYAYLKAAIESELRRREFERTVDEAWNRYRSEIREATGNESRFEEVDQGDAEDRWDGLERYLENVKKPDLESELEGGGLFNFGFGGGDVQEELDRVNERLNEIRELEERWNNLKDLRGEADERRKLARGDIRTLRNQFEDAIDDIGDDINDLDVEREKLETKRDTLAGQERGRLSLKRFDPERFAKMALENPDNITEDDLERIRNGEWSIEDLITEGLTTRDRIEDNLRYLIQREMDERMSDMARTKPDGLLALLRHEENASFDSDVRQIVSARQTRIKHVTDPMAIRDPQTIRLLAAYTPIDLSETSEFGVLYEYHEEREDESLVTLLMSDDDVDDIEDRYVRFAYPELIGQSDDVTGGEDMVRAED